MRKLVIVSSLLMKRSTHSTSSLSKRPVTLITFDVDGTLIQGNSHAAHESAHARAFGYAVGKVFGGVEDWHVKNPSPPLVIPPERYHGSTDGIVALNLAYYGFKIDPKDSFPKLKVVFREMYNYMANLTDEEAVRGIDVLPGVIKQLQRLSSSTAHQNGDILCGLVTGNVEGIARKKMRAVGILNTKVFSKRAADQDFEGEDDHSFLGGFGSCYCSGDIHDLSRLYKDRGEQILIAVRRARSLLSPEQKLVRVVHVGDAPSDVLAARYCVEQGGLAAEGVAVGMVAVATGKFTSEELQELCQGATQPHGYWDPVVLEKGIADDSFIDCCKIVEMLV